MNIGENDRGTPKIGLRRSVGREGMGQEEHHGAVHHAAAPAALSQGHSHPQRAAQPLGQVRPLELGKSKDAKIS